MMFRILAFLLLPVICVAQVNSNGEKPTGELLSNEISPNDMKRNASFNLDEIKVRWKKAALENCPGVPCVVTPPAPSFTCGKSTISDVDNNVYETVSIDNQCWTKQNLRVSRYNDNSPIDLDASGSTNGYTPPQSWSTRISGAYTIYANESSTLTNGNASNYGYLYNWYAATDSRKLCPKGWHVPTDGEWTLLTNFLGGDLLAGSKMKSMDPILWSSFNTDADNTSGFSALPGGLRDNFGEFKDINKEPWFWSATQYNPLEALVRSLNRFDGNVNISNQFMVYGFSIRCLKD